MSVSRIKRYFLSKLKNNISNEQTLSLMSQNSIWFYSQMKSGTTYTVIFLMNYLNELNQCNLSKKDILLQVPYFHTMEKAIKRYSVAKIRYNQRLVLKECMPYLLHTHIAINDFSLKRILITRNPLDYLVSSYFFHYVNRDRDIPLVKVWKKIVDKFVCHHLQQVNIYKELPDTTLFLSYEEVVTSPSIEFKRLVNFLGLKYDDAVLDKALLNSQQNEVKETEKLVGQAIVAGNDYNKDSFIRSGKIGDWKKHIDEDLKNKIISYLRDNNIDIEQFVYE